MRNRKFIWSGLISFSSGVFSAGDEGGRPITIMPLFSDMIVQIFASIHSTQTAHAQKNNGQMKRIFLIDAGGDEKLIINKWWPYTDGLARINGRNGGNSKNKQNN